MRSAAMAYLWRSGADVQGSRLTAEDDRALSRSGHHTRSATRFIERGRIMFLASLQRSSVASLAATQTVLPFGQVDRRRMRNCC